MGKLNFLFIGIISCFIFNSCENKAPYIDIRNTEKIVLNDCNEARKDYILNENDSLLELFMRNVVNTKRSVHESLKIHTGFVKIYVHMRNGLKYEIHVVKMIKTEPVVYFPSTGGKFYNSDMNNFFFLLKKRFPSFNWCQTM